MDKKGYFKEGGEEYENKYDANNPYYGNVKQEMKDGTTNEGGNNPNDFWTKIKHPTQEEIIAHNRKEVEKKEQSTKAHTIGPDGVEYNKDGKDMILVEKDFLEKLKDFEYWKEWKHRK